MQVCFMNRYIDRGKWSYFNSKLPTFLVTIFTMGGHWTPAYFKEYKLAIVVVDVFEVSGEGLQG